MNMFPKNGSVTMCKYANGIESEVSDVRKSGDDAVTDG